MAWSGGWEQPLDHTAETRVKFQAKMLHWLQWNRVDGICKYVIQTHEEVSCMALQRRGFVFDHLEITRYKKCMPNRVCAVDGCIWGKSACDRFIDMSFVWSGVMCALFAVVPLGDGFTAEEGTKLSERIAVSNWVDLCMHRKCNPENATTNSRVTKFHVGRVSTYYHS